MFGYEDELNYKIEKLTLKLIEIRQHLADYIVTEGCGCCSNHNKHREIRNKLGELLQVDKYEDDNESYNFYKYKSV